MSSAILAGSLFAIVTTPLAILGSHPFDLEVRGQTVFSGKLEDVAGLYIGVAAIASVGIGALGSRSASEEKRRLGSAPLQDASAASTPPLALPAPSAPKSIDADALSPLRLKAAGLDVFLEDGSETQPAKALSSSLESNLPESNSLQSSEFQSVAPDEWLAGEQSSIESQPLSLQSSALVMLPEPGAIVQPSTASAAPGLALEPALIEAHHSQQDAEQAITLEGWAEAFLSDRPLVPLDSPTTLPAEEAQSLQPPVSDWAGEEAVQPKQAIAAISPTLSVLQSVPSPTLAARPVNPVMPAAQTYLSFTHSSSTEALYSPTQNRNLQMELEALAKLEQVREQIQVLSAQMEMIQSSLSLHEYSGQHLVALPSAHQQPTYTVNAMEVSAEQEPQKQSYASSIQRAIAS